MSKKFVYFSLPCAFMVLTACVSIADKNLYLSDSSSLNTSLASCDTQRVTAQRTQSTSSLNPESIAFLNWNIYKGDGDNWQQDLAGFAGSHDVMTIQEAVSDDSMTGLFEQHDLSWIMNTAFDFNGSSAGVMNIARSSAVYSCGFKVTEPLIRIPKTVLVSYYPIDGSDKKLLIANIHGINFTFGVSVYRQQLDGLYEAVRHHDGPMIVAGDFNSWSEQRMLAVQELVGKLSLSTIEYPVNNKTHVFGNAIDHVFYRQLELVSNRVWQVSSSDHNPISADFRLISEAL